MTAKKPALNRWFRKIIKTLIGVIVALTISLVLTVLCVLYIPPIFNGVLDWSLELVPENKNIVYDIQTKDELASYWGIEEPELKDEAFFKQLASVFPPSKRKDVFFARILVIRQFPDVCRHTLVGKHRTIDITWVIERNACRGKR